MTTHADEFGGLKQRLLDSALDTMEGQLDEAEKIVERRFPDVKQSGEARGRLVVALAQAIATNYLAAATVRNLPKG